MNNSHFTEIKEGRKPFRSSWLILLPMQNCVLYFPLMLDCPILSDSSDNAFPKTLFHCLIDFTVRKFSVAL